MTSLEKSGKKAPDEAQIRIALIQQSPYSSYSVSNKIEIGYASKIISTNISLQKCSYESVMECLVQIQKIGLTLNPTLKLVYLVERDGKCVIEVSYIGLIAILKKSGGCKYIDAFIVYSDEEFAYWPASGSLTHKPAYAKSEAEQKKREVIGVYSRAVLNTDDSMYCFMPMWEVDKVRNLTKSSSDKTSFWNLWTEEMIKKTVIKRHFKMLVTGTELESVSTMIEIENENNEMVVQPKTKGKSALFDLNFDEQ